MKTDYPEAFEKCWSLYPKRQPENPKRLAFKAWRARVNEGVPIAVLEAATRGYATSIRARRIEGTERVMMAATFFGPNERFEAYLPASGSRPEPMARHQPTSDVRNLCPEGVGPRSVTSESDQGEIVDPQMAKAWLREIVAKLSGAKSIP